MDQTITPKNIAETLADVLPQAKLLSTSVPSLEVPGLEIMHVAVPKGTEVKEVRVDLEHLLGAPRQTAAVASFSNADSFLQYVSRHALDNTVTWCDFNPQTFALTFTAVIDEHNRMAPGWRKHRAVFTPAMSAEWQAWTSHNAKSFAQVAFAEWIQEHDEDINSTDASVPTSLQMLTMATEFVANEERVLKSSVKLASGGVRLTYIADPDAGTTESMQMFERFALGIPVFHGGSAWALKARLKYRLSNGKVSFFYELVRPDRIHEGAAKELIGEIKAGLGDVPMFLGFCK